MNMHNSLQDAGHFGSSIHEEDPRLQEELHQELPIDKLEFAKIKEYIKDILLGLFKILVWMVIFISFYQLLFSKGGIQDYQKSCLELELQKKEIARLEEENQQLVDEIQHMENDPVYQKKLIREHLGVIAKEEFVVLKAR